MSANNVIDIEIPSNSKVKEGIFFDMSNKEYHEIDGLSSTQFQDLDLSVAIYENRHLFKYDCEAFRVGTLNHTALLEPHLLNNYIETTTKTFESEATKKLIENNPDKEVVALGSIDLAKERAEKVKLVYGAYIEQSLKEVSFIVFDEALGLYRKCRADIWLPNHGVVLDYKTSKEHRPETFRKNSISQYNYDIQSAWYMDTINMVIDKFNLPYPKVSQFGWIISPNYAPYKPFGGLAMPDVIEKGRAKYTALTEKYISVKFENGQDELFKSWHTDEFLKLQNN
ncbi:PD-(D/E)XK nuclease-like domain-containing protein [Aliarcobacter cryaerophilus]|uniref:PD-(D/E)XK nuclease-like domain-containing protein n=1 Tax=Aliarcobacter cryaerophilus TaxID=28198 RepID=UPI000824783F|nr:PD-(D/E)XK nuclease-like domain-containing protein [Aliarcobacter cryaerophilus]